MADQRGESCPLLFGAETVEEPFQTCSETVSEPFRNLSGTARCSSTVWELFQNGSRTDVILNRRNRTGPTSKNGLDIIPSFESILPLLRARELRGAHLSKLLKFD